MFFPVLEAWPVMDASGAVPAKVSGLPVVPGRTTAPIAVAC